MTAVANGRLIVTKRPVHDVRQPLPDHEIRWYASRLTNRYREWQRTQVLPRTNRDGLRLTTTVRSLIRDCLTLDADEVEKAFSDTYAEDLMGFVFKSYSPQKLRIIAALVIHMVAETTPQLLLKSVEPNGKISGHWANATFSNSILESLLDDRFRFSQGMEGLASYYHEAYSALGYREFVRESGVQRHTSVHRNSRRYAAVVAATAVGLPLVGLAALPSVWAPESGQTQAILGMGWVTGRLYGFCMEKTKPGPKPRTHYRLVKPPELRDALASTYRRIPGFLVLVRALLRSEDRAVVRASSVGDGSATWTVLQRFFWLLTQPYHEGLIVTDEPWLDFSHRIRNGRYAIDVGHVAVTEACLGIISAEKIAVHRSNRRLLARLESLR